MSLLRTYEQIATGRHSITGVDAEVHQDLMYLSRVGQNGRQARRDFDFEVDGARKYAFKESRNFGKDRIDLETLFETTRAACEGEDAAHHFRAALGTAGQDREYFLSILFGGLIGEHLSGQEDRREYVVEVMGNAACQGANAFHSLSAQELVFEFFLSSDVSANGQNRFGVAQRVANQGPVGVHKQFAAGFGSIVDVSGPLALLVQNLYGITEPGKILVKEFLSAAPDNFRRGPAMQPLGATVPVSHDASHLRDDNRIVSQVEQ